MFRLSALKPGTGVAGGFQDLADKQLASAGVFAGTCSTNGTLTVTGTTLSSNATNGAQLTYGTTQLQRVTAENTWVTTRFFAVVPNYWANPSVIWNVRDPYLDGRLPIVNTARVGNGPTPIQEGNTAMRCNRIAIWVGLACSLCLLGGAQAAQVQAGPWMIVTENDGRIASMSYANPQTGIGIAQMIELKIGANAMPTQGRIEFKNGVKRDMTKEEIAYFYARLDGPKTAWDYLASKERVNKYSPVRAHLPEKLAGTFIRVIIMDGANFFGKLAFDSARPDEFMLEVPGASGGPIRFENKIVSEVEVVK